MSWTDETIQKIWEKATVVQGMDPAKVRKDQCGAWIARIEYGNRDSLYGWEIDHISPGGSDALGNLRPLQWKNNVDKSDGRLECNVTAEGNTNVDSSCGTGHTK